MVQSRASQRVAPFNTLLLAGLIAGAAILFGFGIGSYPFTDGDAANYSRAARNVIERGQAIALRYDPDNPSPDMDKPPAVIWLIALSFRLFGRSELAARLPHVMVSVGLVWLTAAFARLLFGPRAAYLAAAVLATSAQVFYQAHEPMLDMPLTFCVTASLFCVARFAASGRWVWLQIAWAMAGLGVLVKGPVALVLTVVPAGVFLAAFRGNAAEGGRTRHATGGEDRGDPLGAGGVSIGWRVWAVQTTLGLAVAAAVALPWHVWAWAKDGNAFLEMYVGQLAFGRYLKSAHLPGVGIPAYAGLLLVGSLPWSGAVVAALVVTGRKRVDRGARLLLAWAATVVLFFGLSPDAVFMRYGLVALPAVAMLTGRFLASATVAQVRRAGVLTVVSAILLLAFHVALATSDIGRIGGGLLRAFVLTFSGALLVGGLLAIGSRRRSALAVLLGGAVAAYVVVVAQLPPAMERLYPQRSIARRINREAGTNARVATVRIGSADLTMLSFYLDGRVEDLPDAAALREFLSREPRSWVVEDEGCPLPSDLRSRLALVATYPNRKLLRAGTP